MANIFSQVTIHAAFAVKYRENFILKNCLWAFNTLCLFDTASRGEVIHVIVKCCHDFSKLLRQLTPADNENLPVLTLAYPDEKINTAPAE